jgi:hypothetical protein
VSNLASDIRAATGLTTIPHHDLAHISRLQICTPHEISHDARPKIRSTEALEGAKISADRGSEGVSNDDSTSVLVGAHEDSRAPKTLKS